MKLINLSNDSVIASNVKIADSFFKRLRGLMFTKELHSGHALHIKPCRSVHTFFMNYAIDIIYLNPQNVIIAANEEMQPGKVGKHYREAVSVIELPAGTIEKSKTTIGHKLLFDNKGEISNDD